MEYNSTHGDNEGVEMTGALEDQNDDSNDALNASNFMASSDDDTSVYDSIEFIEVRHSVVYAHTVLGVLFWVIPDELGFRAWDLERMAGCLCVPIGWLADELLNVGGTDMGVAVFQASSLSLNDE